MFILSEKNINVSLSDINKIIITFFSSKSEILNIYDTNFKFDENIIPLITSLFEKAPVIFTYKLYKCIDANIIIKQCQQITYNSNDNTQYETSSFFYDIDIFNNKHVNNINNIKSILIKTIIDDDDKQIVRMYNNIKITDDFTQTILYETEKTVISWMFEWGEFEMLIDINKHNTSVNKNVTYQLNINIIEDNKIIQSRLNNINDIINKIHKIKSIFSINNK